MSNSSNIGFHFVVSINEDLLLAKLLQISMREGRTSQRHTVFELSYFDIRRLLIAIFDFLLFHAVKIYSYAPTLQYRREGLSLKENKPCKKEKDAMPSGIFGTFFRGTYIL